MRAQFLGQQPIDHTPHPAPFGGQASCGFPSPAADYQVPELSIDQLVGIGPTSSIFLFRAWGDSMTGAGIYDGDVLVVDKSKQHKIGNVVLAVVGPEFLVKRLQEDEQGRAVLVAENEQYQPIMLGEDEPLGVLPRYCGHS